MPIVIGTIINQTTVNTGTIGFIIQVSTFLEPTVTFGGYRGTGLLIPWPKTAGENEVAANQTITCFVNAQLVGPGSLLTVEGAGGLPIGSNNTLLTEGATVLDMDLFS